MFCVEKINCARKRAGKKTKKNTGSTPGPILHHGSVKVCARFNGVFGSFTTPSLFTTMSCCRKAVEAQKQKSPQEQKNNNTNTAFQGVGSDQQTVNGEENNMTKKNIKSNT